MEMVTYEDAPVLIVGTDPLAYSLLVCLVQGGHPVTLLTEGPSEAKDKIQRHSAELLRRGRPGLKTNDFEITDKLAGKTDAPLAFILTKESLPEKKNRLAQLEEAMPSDGIIAINTESIPLSEIRHDAWHPGRVIGANWVEPVHTTRFLELIVPQDGDKVIADALVRVATRKWRKDPYLITGDLGIRAKMFAAMVREAFYLVENEYASIEDIDRACRNDAGYYLPFAGNFRYMDLMGAYAYGMVMKDLNPDLSKETGVPSFVKDRIDCGQTGMEKEHGFYQYGQGAAAQWQERFHTFSYQIEEIIRKYPFNDQQDGLKGKDEPKPPPMSKLLIFDAHLDLAMNAIEWNRDLSRPLSEIRLREMHMTDKPDRGRGTVCLPELRKGRIGLVVATQLSRFTPPGSALPGWHSPQQAWAMTQAQLAWYREMEALGEMVQITDLPGLNAHLALWEDETIPDETKPVGYILSLEGADSLVDIAYLEKAYAYGLRAVGLSHFGPGRYAPGTKMEGPLTPKGLELLKEMDAFNLILDVTHLTDEGFTQVMDRYQGPVWASHCNVRKLVPTQRQLTDDQIRRLLERDAVIGGMLDCWALDIRFIDTVSDPWQLNVRLENLVDHWDHICQLAGDSLHVAIGSDLDGIFGTEQAPWNLHSIADLQQYEAILAARGYSPEDISNIFHGNWLRFLQKRGFKGRPLNNIFESAQRSRICK